MELVESLSLGKQGTSGLLIEEGFCGRIRKNEPTVFVVFREQKHVENEREGILSVKTKDTINRSIPALRAIWFLS